MPLPRRKQPVRERLYFQHPNRNQNHKRNDMISALLLSALIAVESSGNPNAVGDNGRAYGVLQIHASVVQDVNRIAGTRYVHADAFDPVKARTICETYLNHYATPARLGRPVTDADLSRMWNGGPQGHKKNATVGYWAKVKAAMGGAK